MKNLTSLEQLEETDSWLEDVCLLKTFDEIAAESLAANDFLTQIKTKRQSQDTLSILREFSKAVRQWMKDNPHELAAIEELELEKMNKLPKEIGLLTNLKELSIIKGLTHLPPEIGQLTCLERLTLACNHLTHLPPEIGQLTNLKSIYLDSNELIGLPIEINNLTKLETLHLANNKIKNLQIDFSKLTKLNDIFLSDDQLDINSPNYIGNYFKDFKGTIFNERDLREFADKLMATSPLSYIAMIASAIDPEQ